MAVADREHWAEGRLRLEERPANEELRRAFMKQAHHHLAVIYAGAPALFSGLQRAMGWEEPPPPREIFAWAKALTSTYRSFKWAQEGSLPPRSQAPTNQTGTLPLRPFVHRPSRSQVGHEGPSYEEAKSLFMRGLPPKDGLMGIPSPSVRQVAEHLGFPVKDLQRRATVEGWIRARKDVDSLAHRVHWEEVMGMVDPEAVKAFTRKFIQGLQCLIDWVRRSLHLGTPAPRDLDILAGASRMALKVEKEVRMDLAISSPNMPGFFPLLNTIGMMESPVP